MRGARNSLISSWIAYETSRISIFVDLELLELDENGIWINDRENLNDISADGRLEFEETFIGEPDSSFGQNEFNESPIGDSETIDAPRPESPIESIESPSELETPQLDTPLSDDSGNRFGLLRNILGRK